MLSKTEREYLSGNYSPTTQYERVIKHRIKTKLKKFFMLELPLLQNVTEFSNTITEFSNNAIDNGENEVARPRFELGSRAPKAPMLDRYTRWIILYRASGR